MDVTSGQGERSQLGAALERMRAARAPVSEAIEAILGAGADDPISAFAASEHRVRLLAEGISDVVYVAGPDRIVVWVSPSVTSVLGWEPEDVVGRPMSDFGHPSDVQESGHMRTDLYAGGEIRRNDVLIRMRTRAGGYRWMTGEGVALTDESGKVRGVLSSLQDVHELVRARDAAREAQEQAAITQLSMDRARVGMAMATPDGTFTYINPAFCSMLGYAREDMIGKSFTEFTYGPDIEPGLEGMRALVRGDIDAWSVRKRYVHSSGRLIWGDLSVVLVRNPDGSVRHQVSQVVDVTTEVTFADELKATAEKFRLLAENASDAVWQISKDGRITWVSAGSADTLGWLTDELLGRRVEEIFYFSDRPVLAECLRSVVEEGHIRRMRMRAVTRDDRFRWVSMRARGLHAGPDGGVVLALRDIHAEVLASEALEDSARERERALVVADQLRIARDLHDHVIQSLFASGLKLGAISSRLDDGVTAHELSSVMGTLDEAISTLRSTIFNITSKELDKPLSKRITQIVESVSADSGLNVLPVFRGPIDIEVNAELEHEATAVVHELLTNVVKHANARNAEVLVEVREERLVICVSDDGVGMSVAPRTKPERRLDGVAHGLGHHNVSARAAALGGACTVEPGGIARGHGVRVHWEVPLHPVP